MGTDWAGAAFCKEAWEGPGKYCWRRDLSDVRWQAFWTSEA